MEDVREGENPSYSRTYPLVGFGLGLLRLFLPTNIGMSSSSLSLAYLSRGVGRGATRRTPVWEGEGEGEANTIQPVSPSGCGLLISYFDLLKLHTISIAQLAFTTHLLIVYKHAWQVCKTAAPHVPNTLLVFTCIYAGMSMSLMGAHYEHHMINIPASAPGHVYNRLGTRLSISLMLSWGTA